MTSAERAVYAAAFAVAAVQQRSPPGGCAEYAFEAVISLRQAKPRFDEVREMLDVFRDPRGES